MIESNSFRGVATVLPTLLLLLAAQADGQPQDDSQRQEIDFFEKKIRPLLIDNCLDCHGDDAEGKLRLDSKTGWTRGGERGPAIVPGDPGASLLFQAITHRDPKQKMPPADYGDPLTPAQIADVEKWIRQGAFDPRDGKVVREIDLQAESHWAFQPIPQSFPDFNGQHPIDFFVDRNLKTKGLATTARADPHALIRRSTYDLLGLPPTDKQIQLGTTDYAGLVEELLSSPHYGERWGRHWLDIARYSDAKDGVLMYGDARIRPFAYTYRDYVIRAFNEDLPFDEFVRHQLAADQMDLPADSRYLAGMGFLTLGRMFDLNRHDVIDDQIDVVSRGFLGLTASCSRCHDHKFDPIPTADYYSLYGVFASTIQPLDRPRIANVSPAGEAFETELENHLKRIADLEEKHYQRTLKTARDKTTEYLVRVATTEPDYAETAVFFKSLVPGHLRPQIVHRWRKLIARRAHPHDPIFSPWHDLFQRFNRWKALKSSNQDRQVFLDRSENQIERLAKRWRQVKVDEQLISLLIQKNPLTPAEIAQSYGSLLGTLQSEIKSQNSKLANLNAKIRSLDANSFDLADIVAGGLGFGTGKKGTGIHPATGQPTAGKTGFIDIPKPDQLVPVPSHPMIDGVFVPQSGATTVSSTGIKIDDLPTTSGKTWDYLKNDLSSGSSETKVGGVDFSQAPNQVVAMHANKGVTFDLQQFRSRVPFTESNFQMLLGNSGAKGQSQIDFFVYLDGQQVLAIRDFKSQSAGRPIDIPLSPQTRFLTLIALEGKQGISHDQVILGNPKITYRRLDTTAANSQQLKAWKQQSLEIQKQLRHLKNSMAAHPFQKLLLSKDGPIWFPKEEVEYYLSRQDRDQFRGLLNQVDSIAVRHPAAADRAMILKDRTQLVAPVIFQRGDPGQKGNAVQRTTLKLLDPQQKPFVKGSGRLELAESITAPDNPLTARVWVNRVWMHHFGEPLVASPSDFGLQSKPPRQLELLDFLARYFMRNGWRTKPLHRLIMNSATYQRSSLVTDQLAHQQQLDPNNSYLWRGNRRRLDLEQMRDSMLWAAGRLDRTMFGRPQSITDLNNRRRTIYAFVERQNLPDIIQSFDSANADSSTARRPKTTVPQQALFAMNSQFVLTQAKALAKELEQLPDDDRKIKALYHRLFQREPNAREAKVLGLQIESLGTEQLAHVLLMTNEFMFVD